MMMIEKVMGINFVKVIFITDIKAQTPIEPIISKDVPSTSAAPTTCSGTAPPPPTVVSEGAQEYFPHVLGHSAALGRSP
jgi:hypothetical protein